MSNHTHSLCVIAKWLSRSEYNKNMQESMNTSSNNYLASWPHIMAMTAEKKPQHKERNIPRIQDV